VIEALNMGDKVVLDECLAAHLLRLDGQTMPLNTVGVTR
jgi:hypothetical protein